MATKHDTTEQDTDMAATVIVAGGFVLTATILMMLTEIVVNTGISVWQITTAASTTAAIVYAYLYKEMIEDD